MAHSSSEHEDTNDVLTLIPEREVADRWGKSLRTLQRWRYQRIGPAYIRIGGTIFYRPGDILAFEDAHRWSAGADR